jgi:hypothetical protein
MGPLTAIGLCALLVSGSQMKQNCGPVTAVSSLLIDRWQSDILEASRRFSMPEDWIRAVMKQESAGLATLNGQPITSSAGAMGLMQLMPKTWREMRNRYGLGSNPYDTRDNIFAGAAYLRKMYDRYGYPDLFAAYHAGPGHMDAFLAGEKPLPDATLAYVKAIIPGFEIPSFSMEKSSAKLSKSNPDSLFFVRAESKNPSPKESVPDSKSAKSIGENRSRQVDDAVAGKNSLFIPLTNSAR